MATLENTEEANRNDPDGFVVERRVPSTYLPTEEPPCDPSPVKLPEGREPLVPGVPPQTGKARVVTPELWVLVRAVAEGRRFSLDGLSDLTGISLTSIKDRCVREKWMTPDRMKKENLKRIDAVMGPIFDEINDYIANNATPGDLPGGNATGVPHKLLDEVGQNVTPATLTEQSSDEIIDSTDASGMDLRDYVETPAKFRPKDHDLLPLGGGGGVTAFLEKIKRAQYDVKHEMAKRADVHKLLVSEIAQQGLAHVAQKVQDDPGLAVLLAGNIEKLEKMGRRNLGLDDNRDPLGGARAVLIMSDPTMIPRPAITIEAEEVEIDDGPDEAFPEDVDVNYEEELRN